jgi:hypothetical protein
MSKAGVMGLNTCYGLRDVTDGTSNTFLLGELSWNNAKVYRIFVRGILYNSDGASGGAKSITYGINLQAMTSASYFNTTSFGSEHPGGCQFAMCDASVRFVSQNIDMDIYRATASRAGGESKTVSQQ